MSGVYRSIRANLSRGLEVDLQQVTVDVRQVSVTGFRLADHPDCLPQFGFGLQSVPRHPVEQFVHCLWRLSGAAIEPPFQK